MKKIVCLLLAAMLLLTACGTGAEESTTTAAAADNKLRAQIGGAEVVFEPLEQAKLPAEGAYYLTDDVVLEGPVTVSGKLQLHLNGHKIAGTEGVDYGSLFTVPAGGELVVYDAEDGLGTIVSPRSFTAKPTVKHMFQVEGTMTLAGGTVDASVISLENVANGGAFYVADGGVLNIAGGEVIGGTMLCTSLNPEPKPDPNAQQAEADAAAQEGEKTEETVVEEESTVVEEEIPEPVEIIGKGGSVFVAVGGTCNISGGTVTAGYAGLGGNIFVDANESGAGLLNISGGKISSGEAMFNGGNIYALGTVKMSDGLLLEGRAYSNGGNIYLEGTLEMTGGILEAGRCDHNGRAGKRGANLLVNGLNAVVNIDNAQFIDGDGHGSENFGGNISVIGQCAREFSITNTTISGGQGHRGGNVYIGTLAKDVNPENLDYYMKNVTISEGSCSYRGANLCMDSDLEDVYINLVMDDCTFVCEDSTRETISLGAGSWVNTWVTLTMNGGAIQGGSLTIYGDATLTCNGTAIEKEVFGGAGKLVVNP